jgi:hypothetical protein
MVNGVFTPKNALEAAKGHAADAYGAVKGHAADAYGAVKGHAADARSDFGHLVNPNMAHESASTTPARILAAKRLAGNPLVYGTAGAGALGAVGGGAYALGREKQAAVAGLTNAGVDFDTAVGLVNAKSQELYGA